MALASSLFQGNPRIDEASAPGGRSIKRAPPHDDAEAVRRIQKAMLQLGRPMASSFPNGTSQEPDGKFGQDMFLQVIEFQKQAFPNSPQEWDGRVGPKTLAAMDQRLSKGGKTSADNVAPSSTKTTTGDALNVIEQPPSELFLISRRKDNPNKGDLDSSNRPISASGFARARVAMLRLLPTFSLQDNMRLELVLAGPLGLMMLDAFINNTTRAAEKSFPQLNAKVANSGAFLSEARDAEQQVLANLRAQLATQKIDYHDLVTGPGPDRSPQSPVLPIEAGRATGRLLPSVDLGLFGFSFSNDPVLKIVVGNFQGSSLFLKNFQVFPGKGGEPTKCTGTLVYEYRDHFGVDDSDVEMDLGLHGSPGQASFWVLQHDRHTPGHFPFVTVVRVERKFSEQLL